MSTIKKLLKSDLSTGLLLIFSTFLALIIANGPLEHGYHHLFHEINIIGEFNLHMIINDFLMAIFFLVVGIEIRKEIKYGNLSSIKKASFPVIAAFGGVIVPALIFTFINLNTDFTHAVGIPISTDIAFAVAMFLLLKNKLDPKLKIFLLSLAVVDDLISIIVIGFLYSSNINLSFLLMGVVVLGVVLALNKVFKVKNTFVYVLLGLILWAVIFKSGVHATISGVLLAFALPISNKEHNVADTLEHSLSPITNSFILPLFAFANTAINLNVNVNFASVDTLFYGIIFGLVIGKPLGIMLFTYIASKLHIAEKPNNISWSCIFKVSILAGIGFTMSIFVSQLAFSSNQGLIDISKIAILVSSVLSISIAFIAIIVVPYVKGKCILCKLQALMK